MCGKVFVKYRYMFASGYEQWDFVELHNDDEEIKEYFRELADEYYWSDKFRKIEWEAVSRPPDDWLREQVKLACDKIEYNKGIIKRYNELLGD